MSYPVISDIHPWNGTEAMRRMAYDTLHRKDNWRLMVSRIVLSEQFRLVAQPIGREIRDRTDRGTR